MKQIKFNEPKVLKALLEKTKTSTLRKAYYIDVQIIPKLCKYELGEVIELVWTGKDNDSISSFVKKGDILGKVRIASIDKVDIEFFKLNGIMEILHKKRVVTSDGISALSYTEGFDSTSEMFKFLLSYAPKIQERAMPFWLIEWIYL